MNFSRRWKPSFTMTQWYPRLCVCIQISGWQNHQFTGRGEFALTFGNFKVNMNVPADHIVSFYRFGKLLRSFNPEQFARWQKAQILKNQ
jgi:hypothetical protein